MISATSVNDCVDVRQMSGRDYRVCVDFGIWPSDRLILVASFVFILCLRKQEQKSRKEAGCESWPM